MFSRSARAIVVLALACLLSSVGEAVKTGSAAIATRSVDITLGSSAQCHGRAPTIVGTPGPDVIQGTSKRDVILARAGNDVVHAGAKRDVICGGQGQDAILGGPGDDLLLGADGDDILRPGRAFYQDTIGPGRGDDVVRAKTAASFQACVLYRHSPGPVAIDLVAHSATGTSGEDRLFGVDCVVGSPYADQIRGRGLRSESLYGGAGNDIIDGHGGLDFIRGEEGDDAIETGSTGLPRGRGCTDIVGGPGADHVSGGRGCQYVEGGEGPDRIDVGPGPDIVISVYSDAGSRPLDYAVDVAIGRAGRDLLVGQEGRDILRGGVGRDSLHGGAGDDDLFGGRHLDTGRGGGDRSGDLCVSIERARGCES